MAVCRKTSSYVFSLVAAPVNFLSSVLAFSDVCGVAVSFFHKTFLLALKKSVVLRSTFLASRSRTILTTISRPKTVEAQLFHFDQLRFVSD